MTVTYDDDDFDHRDDDDGDDGDDDDDTGTGGSWVWRSLLERNIARSLTCANSFQDNTHSLKSLPG